MGGTDRQANHLNTFHLIIRHGTQPNFKLAVHFFLDLSFMLFYAGLDILLKLYDNDVMRSYWSRDSKIV